MSEFKLTLSQTEAVESRENPILVSAAAGSGKTRVLTERLIARVMEGENINRFLVITFTRAAAAELRSRILTALNERAAADPGNAHLRRQRALLYRAQIGTIDSFCATLLRENAQLVGVSPSFSTLEDDRAQNLRARALDEVMERAYETIGDNPGLQALVDSVGAGRDDRRLSELVLAVDDQMKSRAFPEQWAAEKLAALDVSGLTDAANTPWGAFLLKDAAAEAAYRAEALEQAIQIMAQPGNEKLMKAYGEAYAELALCFRDVTRAAGEGWDKTKLALEWPKIALKGVRDFPDEDLKNRVKAVWDDAKKAAEKLKKTLAGDSASLLRGIAASKPALTALMELVFALDKEYAARKRRADACDFSDVEHFCIKLLCDDQGGPTALAKTISQRFTEVMVDDYQDVNEVQELIFTRLSHEGKNLFMVGDVKQSIYRFRLAEPAIFNRKYAQFAAGEAGKRILLRENFRSRKCVLDACNGVFERIMSPALGDIAYNDEARLVCGATGYLPEEETLAELCVLEPPAGGDDGEEVPNKTLREARYVAGRIRDMVEARALVSDGQGGQRPVTYGDIAVLMRAPKTSGGVYRRALAEAGVPVNARQGSNFFSQPEVSFALSMLAVADNPRQDVPLIAAMRGLPFTFTPDELSAVRAMGKGDFWDALRLRAEEDARCRQFVDTVLQLRDLALTEPTDGLLRWLYDKTQLLTVCGAMADASARIGNLMQLYEYARKFESDGNRGLFRFVTWLRELERRGMEPPAPIGGSAVEIMSIHKSKGLEFPVVFLVDLNHGWGNTAPAQVLCHSGLGLGMVMTDAERGVRWPTLPWRAIDRLERQEDLSEQERVLYVAMTRAKERLIMTCTVPKAAGKLAAMGGPGDGPISPRSLATAQSAAQWLMAAAVADGGRTIDLKLVTPEQAEAPSLAETAPLQPADPALVDALAERLSWRYPFEDAVALPSKLTATAAKELAPGNGDEEAAELPGAIHVTDRLRTPDFGREVRPLTGPERGVAAHLVMQYIDFAKTDSGEAIAGEIDRLREKGFLDERQAGAVEPADILAFFQSELGRRVLEADEVIREFRFSLLCPATQWYPQAPEGETVLLQGVVDCCIREGDSLTVIDFKTDGQIQPGRYDGQVQAYAAALERIYNLPVKEAALWYLRRRQGQICPVRR